MSDYVFRCDYCSRLVPATKPHLAWREAETLWAPDSDPDAEPGSYRWYDVLIPAAYCGPYCAEQSTLTFAGTTRG